MNIELEPAPQMSGQLSKFAVERCVFIIELWNGEIYGWLPLIGSTLGLYSNLCFQRLGSRKDLVRILYTHGANIW